MPNTIGFTFSDQFTLFKKWKTIDSRSRHLTKETNIIDTRGEPFELKPRQFLLAKTVEKIAIQTDIAATLQGRSSIARLGIVVACRDKAFPAMSSALGIANIGPSP
jgi:dCTP deaminase